MIKAAFERLRDNPGVRRMHAELQTLGYQLSRKRVWRLMKTADLQGRHPRAWKRTTVPGDSPVPAPDLLGRDFTAEQPNSRWCGDMTYSAQLAVLCSPTGQRQDQPSLALLRLWIILGSSREESP